MTFGVFCSANLPVKNALINSTLDIFVIVIIIVTNVSVYINHPQYYQGHKLCVNLTTNCHLNCHTSSIVKKRLMSLKFQVYGNRKVKLKFDPEVKWHP